LRKENELKRAQLRKEIQEFEVMHRAPEAPAAPVPPETPAPPAQKTFGERLGSAWKSTSGAFKRAGGIAAQGVGGFLQWVYWATGEILWKTFADKDFPKEWTPIFLREVGEGEKQSGKK
jgi:hypothetical protein